MLTKRSLTTEDDVEPATKRAKHTHDDDQWWLSQVKRAAQDKTIERLTSLLQQDPARTKTLLLQHPEHRRVLTTMFAELFDFKTPEQYFYLLQRDAMLPWKHLYAESFTQGWFLPDGISDLMVLPLFADLPEYHRALQLHIRLNPSYKVLSYVTFASFTIVDWAFQLNNVPLLQWCHETRCADDSPLFSESTWTTCERIFRDKAPEAATLIWWKAHVVEDKDQVTIEDVTDEEDEVDALVAIERQRVVDLTLDE